MKKKLHNLYKTVLPILLTPVIKFALRFILFSCRKEIHGLKQFAQIAEKERCILMLWHNRLVIMPEFLRKYTPQFIYCALISKSRDGELLAKMANSYAAGRTLRVPHDARHQALSKMISQLKQNKEIMVLTPDGPKGPIYKIKPGVVIAAREAPAVVIPFTWSAKRYWQLNTWDKMIIPKPFTTIVAKFGDPIHVKKGRTVEEEMTRFENSLKTL